MVRHVGFDHTGPRRMKPRFTLTVPRPEIRRDWLAILFLLCWIGLWSSGLWIGAHAMLSPPEALSPDARYALGFALGAAAAVWLAAVRLLVRRLRGTRRAPEALGRLAGEDRS